MDLVFERLTIWLAPLIPFTMEEAWTTRFPEAGSNCLRIFPETPAAWSHPAEADRWAKVQAVTRVVMGALEAERREKRIGGPLDAAPVVYLSNQYLFRAFEGLDPAEVFRTSQASLKPVLTPGNFLDTFKSTRNPDGMMGFVVSNVLKADLPEPETGAVIFSLPDVAGVMVEPRKAEGRKCARSWRILPEVGQDPRYPDLSLRDAEAVAAWDAARV
jgi:isoleucyl-tRNA synthetase